MGIDFSSFLGALVSDPVLAVIVVLAIGATMVNGATDAPNAIATVVGTRAMRPFPAIIMAAICNLVGLLGITAVSTAVASTIFKMVDFGGDNHAALVALAAAMVAIIVWGVAAWALGIPTSQSHSLIAGITGAAIALQGGLAGGRLAKGQQRTENRQPAKANAGQGNASIHNTRLLSNIYEKRLVICHFAGEGSFSCQNAAAGKGPARAG